MLRCEYMFKACLTIFQHFSTLSFKWSANLRHERDLCHGNSCYDKKTKEKKYVQEST